MPDTQCPLPPHNLPNALRHPILTVLGMFGPHTNISMGRFWDVVCYDLRVTQCIDYTCREHAPLITTLKVLCAKTLLIVKFFAQKEAIHSL